VLGRGGELTVEASSDGETGRVGRETVIGIEVVDVELTVMYVGVHVAELVVVTRLFVDTITGLTAMIVRPSPDF